MLKSKYPIPIIDIFSGIGCASLGFKKAGFEIAAALEVDPLRCKIYEKNLKIKPLQNDVMKTNGKQLLANAKLRKGSKFCVVGCPPCQSFSCLSNTKGIDTLTDPRSKYVRKFAQLIIEMKPAAVVFENVHGMVTGSGKIFFNNYINTLEKNGYVTSYRTINAADYGVPQTRRRIVAISIRKKFLKKNTINEVEEFLSISRKKHKTVRDAIRKLKPLRIGQQDPTDFHHFARLHNKNVNRMIRHVPKNGGSRKDIPRRYWLNCHKKITHGAESVYGRMSWDDPSPTITCRCTTPACGRFIHPSQNRGISMREAACLQTIPKYFKLGNNRQKNEEMIGDAVPVLLANKIAKKLFQVIS